MDYFDILHLAAMEKIRSFYKRIWNLLGCFVGSLFVVRLSFGVFSLAGFVFPPFEANVIWGLSCLSGLSGSGFSSSCHACSGWGRWWSEPRPNSYGPGNKTACCYPTNSPKFESTNDKCGCYQQCWGSKVFNCK